MGFAATLIAEARSRAGLGLRELARRAGTSHATLLRYERGEIDPRSETLLRIIHACGYEPRVLLEPPDEQDAALWDSFGRLTPEERLLSLQRWAALRADSGEP